jgi:2-polyprenyl-3-methyl-5-hydroxy-6-metoxy-1,4-benzoquinol methylase
MTTTTESDRRSVRETLQDPTIHELWEKTYRTSQCERFYEKVFDRILAAGGLTTDANALDIGCGIGQHSIRMATRGLKVVAADFSDNRVASAQHNIAAYGLADRIAVCKEDLEQGLSFSPESFDLVLCWGVIMHIPDNERAMSELVRVARVGGKIILYEANLLGLDALTTAVVAILKAALGQSKAKKIVINRYGLEYWVRAESGDLLVRHTRAASLQQFFSAHGCRLEFRTAGQFTEQFSRFARFPAAQSLIHWFNSAWFSVARVPYFAHGNLFMFRRIA